LDIFEKNAHRNGHDVSFFVVCAANISRQRSALMTCGTMRSSSIIIVPAAKKYDATTTRGE
jgi:hypothetical protein